MPHGPGRPVSAAARAAAGLVVLAVLGLGTAPAVAATTASPTASPTPSRGVPAGPLVVPTGSPSASPTPTPTPAASRPRSASDPVTRLLLVGVAAAVVLGLLGGGGLWLTRRR